MAERLFARALPAVMDFTSPRAWAFSLIGLHEYPPQRSGSGAAGGVRDELTSRLVRIFDKVAKPGWIWFEEGLTYDNAKLAHALIVSGRATGQKSVSDRGMRALRWLMEAQTSPRGHLRPIGSDGFFRRDGRARGVRPTAHRGADHGFGLPGSISGHGRPMVVRAGAMRL